MDGLSIESIRDAARTIKGRVHRTPLVRSQALSLASGYEVFLKAENLQKTGSFKPRGALNRILRIPETERRRGVVAASAGNHAQGLAYAAAHVGIPALVVMPETAPHAKLEAVRGYGAEVEQVGRMFDDCVRRSEEICAARGMSYVHPCTDADVVAGAGTIGLEIVDDLPDVDAVVVPIGGGGLIAGIAVAVHALRPRAAIYGVQPRGSPPMERSFRAGRLIAVPKAATIADGLIGREVYQPTLDVVLAHCQDIVLVSDQALVDAIVTILTRCKLLTESSGAAAVAALKALDLPRGRRVVCVLSGGNQDLALLAGWIEHGLEQGHEPRPKSRSALR
jgi:threonine dehydratase